MSPVDVKLLFSLSHSLHDSRPRLCAGGIKMDARDAVLPALKEPPLWWETEINYYKGMISSICGKQGQLPES